MAAGWARREERSGDSSRRVLDGAACGPTEPARPGRGRIEDAGRSRKPSCRADQRGVRRRRPGAPRQRAARSRAQNERTPVAVRIKDGRGDARAVLASNEALARLRGRRERRARYEDKLAKTGWSSREDAGREILRAARTPADDGRMLT